MEKHSHNLLGDQRLVAVIAISSAVLYGGMVYAALSSQQMLFADGAPYAYIAGLREPWSLFWANNPARIGSMLVMVFPAYLAGKIFGLGPLSTSFAYQASVFAFPVFTLCLTWSWLPRERRDLFVPVLAYMLGVGLTAFSYPTEVAVTVSFFWPLLAGALFPRPGPLRFAAMIGIAFIFCFSHSFMIFGVPILLLAARRAAKDIDTATRRWLLAAIVALAALTAAGLTLAAVQKPFNPLVARALAENAHDLPFTAIDLLAYPAFVASGVMLAAMVVCTTLSEKRHQIACICAAVLIDAAVMSRVEASFLPSDNYLARTGLGGLLPIAGLFVLDLHSRRRAIPRWAAAVVMIVLMLNHTLYEAVFVTAWDRYRQALGATIAASGPPAIGFKESAAADLVRKGDVAGRFAWPWVVPYQSMMIRLPGGEQRTRLILDDLGWFVPFTCRDSQRLERPDYVAPAAFQELVADICRKSPL